MLVHALTTDLISFQLIVSCSIRDHEVECIKGTLGEFGSASQHGVSDNNCIDDFQLIGTTYRL